MVESVKGAELTVKFLNRPRGPKTPESVTEVTNFWDEVANKYFGRNVPTRDRADDLAALLNTRDSLYPEDIDTVLSEALNKNLTECQGFMNLEACWYMLTLNLRENLDKPNFYKNVERPGRIYLEDAQEGVAILNCNLPPMTQRSEIKETLTRLITQYLPPNGEKKYKAFKIAVLQLITTGKTTETPPPDEKTPFTADELRPLIKPTYSDGEMDCLAQAFHILNRIVLPYGYSKTQATLDFQTISAINALNDPGIKYLNGTLEISNVSEECIKKLLENRNIPRSDKEIIQRAFQKSQIFHAEILKIILNGHRKLVLGQLARVFTASKKRVALLFHAGMAVKIAGMDPDNPADATILRNMVHQAGKNIIYVLPFIKAFCPEKAEKIFAAMKLTASDRKMLEKILRSHKVQEFLKDFQKIA